MIALSHASSSRGALGVAAPAVRATRGRPHTAVLRGGSTTSQRSPFRFFAHPLHIHEGSRSRAVRVRAAGPNPRGARKMSSKKIKKKRQEFIEQDNEKDALAAQMREAAYKATRQTGSQSVDEGDARGAGSPGASFEEKLAAVREQGAEVRAAREAAAPTLMDDMVAGQKGRGVPTLPKKSIYDEAPGGITLGEVGKKSQEDEGLNGFIRIGAGICALGLLVVFLPSDDFISSPVAPQKELTPEVIEQVRKQAEEYTAELKNSPEDVVKLKSAAESYVVLEDYAAAIPLLQKLLEVEFTDSNVGNLADVYYASGQKFKAAEVYKNAVDHDWSAEGGKPSPTLLKGFVDALGRDGRQGLALSFVKDFKAKGYTDDVDQALLEARVFSGWKGHGKEAEEAYQAVIDGHADDFRGYLAKGVFMREIGKPDQADALFRQAKSLAPGEMSEVVAAVIKQAKAQN